MSTMPTFVVAVGVEGRVEVDEVYGGGGDVVAEDVEVVAVEEGVVGDGLGRHGWASFLV
jgi:hypothetical protein